MIWKSVARRVAAVTRPTATSASAARSVVRESSPIAGTSQVSARASATAPPTRSERRDARANRSRLARAAHEEEEQHREHHRPHGQCYGRDEVAAGRRLVERDAREHERLRGDQRDGDRAPPDDDDAAARARPASSASPPLTPASASQATMPSSAATRPTASSHGTSRTRILATSVSVSARPRRAATSTAGRTASCHQHAVRMGQEHLRREHEHEPVARGGPPLEIGEVAPGVLEQRPLVDHRQLEVRVGVVDRLAPRLGDDDERERRRRRARAPGSTRCAVPAVPATMPRRSVVAGTSAATASESTSVASTKTEIVRSRLAPISEKPLPTSHAAAASGEPRQREQADEHERIVADAPVRRSARQRERAAPQRPGSRRRRPARADRRRRALRGRPRSCPTAAAGPGRAAAASGRGDPAAAPSSAGRVRAASGASSDPADELRRTRARGCARSSDQAQRAAASRTRTSATR